MHKPFLEFIRDGQLYSLKELKAKMTEYFKLDESALTELLHRGRQTIFTNRNGWGHTYLKKAGLIDSPRAMFVITPQGQTVLKDNPSMIDNDYLMRFDSFREFQSASGIYLPDGLPIEDGHGTTPEDTFEEFLNKQQTMPIFNTLF